MIAFYHDALEAVKSSSISEKNMNVAIENLSKLFAPLLPPFPASNLNTWHKSAMSATNEAYFDLLADAIVDQHAINVPEQSDIDIMKQDILDLRQQLEEMKLPRWINDDFEESLALTFIALDKMPFLAHRIINDAHSSILSKLFSSGTAEQKKFMVKVATTINVILAAFVMPHAGYEAATTYYGWISESATDPKQIESIAAPLALPAPSQGSKRK